MAQLVTRNAVITCPHQGQVELTSGQAKVVAEGGEVLCEPDLIGASILGCTQPATPSSKPCMHVVSVTPESVSRTVSVAGKGVYLSTLTGMTDGVPPAMITVGDPGQATVAV
jgi:hypothetical protein